MSTAPPMDTDTITAYWTDWTREGPLSGPANVLNARWEVGRFPPDGPRWGVWDRRLRSWVHTGRGFGRGYRTMREAKAEAYRIAHQARLCGREHPDGRES